MSQTIAGTRPPQLHIPFLDSLRGLAALYVVLNHAYGHMIMENDSTLPPLLRYVYHAMLFGHFAVDVFIVLSGYCLMLPVARSGTLRLRGGFSGYISRRAWRILPPYYLSIVVSLLVYALLAYCRTRGLGVSVPLRTWSAGGLLSHLVLIHNLNPAWDGQINGVLWSVGTEWQIYFVFALLLLPLWQRIGFSKMFGVALVATWLPYAVFHAHLFQDACPWYVVLFATGMAAAFIGESQDTRAIEMRRMLTLTIWPVMLAASTILLAWFGTTHNSLVILDPLVGIAAASAIAMLAVRTNATPQLLVVRLLNSRPMATLGAFSYSIYLIHDPVLSVFRAFLPYVNSNPLGEFFAVIPAEVAVALGISYLFYLCFERPFVSGLKRWHPG